MKELIEKIKAQLEHLNSRERIMVSAAAVAVLVFLPYQFIWVPIVDGVADKRSIVEKKESDLIWMQSKVGEAQRLSRSEPTSAAKGKSLYGIIESTAQQKFGADLQIQQEGNKGIRIQIKQASFDNIMFWLDDLQFRHKITIKDFKVDSTKEVGNVRASILVQS